MKTAISLPDELFRRAEAAARKLRISRSALYAQAIAGFLAHSDSQSVTQQLNEVYSQRRAEVDPQLHRAQLKSLKYAPW